MISTFSLHLQLIDKTLYIHMQDNNDNDLIAWKLGRGIPYNHYYWNTLDSAIQNQELLS